MTLRPSRESVREGDFFADVDVELIVREDDEWSPYFSAQDALKLDAVRAALRKGDLTAAAKLAKVYRLMPVSAA